MVSVSKVSTVGTVGSPTASAASTFSPVSSVFTVYTLYTVNTSKSSASSGRFSSIFLIVIDLLLVSIMTITSRIWLPDLEIMDLMSFQTHKILSKLEGEILTRKGLKTLFSTSVTGKSFVSRRVEIRLIIITLPVIYSNFPVSSDINS